MQNLPGFNPRKPRELDEPNLIPILNLFIVIIFFLIFMSSFQKLTEQALPKASVSTQQLENNDDVPLNPKLIIHTLKDETTTLLLSWEGNNPGSLAKDFIINDTEKLKEETGLLVEEFWKEYPEEKTIQVGMSSKSKLQTLISVLDIVKDKTPSIVMISPEDSEVVISLKKPDQLIKEDSEDNN